MNDRELMELAAKAAGVDFDGHTFVKRDRYSSNVWAPLFDDGDAFRLAVQLGMRIYVYPGGDDNVTVVANDELKAKGAPHISEPHAEDRLAATRRAIVRAAAEMAKGLE
ncbi:hypothetical protein [Pseudomonas syringae]|uniref:hypothetical protein n=1 Tax=Pseudomonas syringae TaxID=317 RepID=UPI000E322698|nr:hypothetical protein [Pseudomonas syringae]